MSLKQLRNQRLSRSSYVKNYPILDWYLAFLTIGEDLLKTYVNLYNQDLLQENAKIALEAIDALTND